MNHRFAGFTGRDGASRFDIRRAWLAAAAHHVLDVSRAEATLMYLTALLRGRSSAQMCSVQSPDVSPEPVMLRAPNSFVHSCNITDRKRQSDSTAMSEHRPSGRCGT